MIEEKDWALTADEANELTAERDRLRIEVEQGNNALKMAAKIHEDGLHDMLEIHSKQMAEKDEDIKRLQTLNLGAMLVGSKSPFHAPSEVPEADREVFSIYSVEDSGGIGFRWNGKWWLTGDTEKFHHNPPFGTPLHLQWKHYRECDSDATMLAWAYCDEMKEYLLGMFYRTPKHVLDYIDAWSEPTTKTEYKKNDAA